MLVHFATWLETVAEYEPLNRKVNKITSAERHPSDISAGEYTRPDVVLTETVATVTSLMVTQF